MEKHQGGIESVNTAARSEPKRQGATQEWDAPISDPMPGLLQRIHANPRTLSPADVRIVQQTIGNRAVVRLLTPSPLPPVSARTQPPNVQRLCSTCEAELQRQGKPVPVQAKIAHSAAHAGGDRCECVECATARRAQGDLGEQALTVQPQRVAGVAPPILPGTNALSKRTKAVFPVQRDIPSPAGQFPPLGPGFPSLDPPKDQLKFTKRIFPNLSQPTVCPRCHDQKPSGPMQPALVDREATAERLRTWGQDSEKILHTPAMVRKLQLDPNVFDIIVDDYGVGLTNRITSSNEFEGSDDARKKGAETNRAHWGDIRTPVRQKLSDWYKEQFIEAMSLTPKWASPVVDPILLKGVLDNPQKGRAPMGRWGAEAVPGQKVGIFEIDDIGRGMIWFHLPGRPVWLYAISEGDFIRHDPFIAAVSEQVYDKTRFIREVTPIIMKVGAFGMGFSGSVAVIIAGIVVDELATEMQSENEGKPGRSFEEIVGSGATQFLIDRIFHGLLGGGASRAVSAAGKGFARVEKMAEKAVPIIRREIVNVEKPLVRQALDAGTARQVTDQALKSEGHLVEVAVEAAGEKHMYRLNKKGVWCRARTSICDLDLGADLVAQAKTPKSFTAARIEDARSLILQAEGEINFLTRIYDRMKTAGKLDLALLSKEERTALEELLPSGDASKLTLAELRDLPKKLGLAQEIKAATSEEAKLVEQLYREGRPLHEIMRAASPSSASRSTVLGEAGGRDAVTGLAPRSGGLHVDHVVPLNEIVRMPSFNKLRPERQLAIVNDVKNLRAMDGLANSSRGDRSWSS